MAAETDPPLKDIVVYALARLGGAKKTVHSEDIAAKCYELARERFAWRLPQYRKKGWPDKYVVKTALVDAKKQDYGGLVEGTYGLDAVKDGWWLTAQGAKWFTENARRIESALSRHSHAGPMTSRERSRFVKQVHSQALFKTFLKTRSVREASRYEFTDFLSCSPDVPQEVIVRKFQTLEATATQAGDQDVISFVDACRRNFSGVLKRDESPKQEEGGL